MSIIGKRIQDSRRYPCKRQLFWNIDKKTKIMEGVYITFKL